MHLNVFVCTEIPRDWPSFRVTHTLTHTQKGSGTTNIETVINRIDIPCAGWITEDICVCESVCLCVPWAQVSVPTTCPPSVLPSFNPSFRLSFHSLASVIKQRLMWHESERETQTAIMPLKVHFYMVSSTILEYTFEILVLCSTAFSTLLQFRGKCTFYSNTSNSHSYKLLPGFLKSNPKA